MQSTVQFLKLNSRFLVTTHDFPDGDGLGSQVALSRALRSLGKTVFTINPGPTPEKFGLVDPRAEIEVFASGKALPQVDGILILDTNETKMLGPMEAAIRQLGKPVVFIDHHVLETVPSAPSLMDENFAATGELVFNLLQALQVKMDLEMATALYVAILTDTAGFRYKRTSAHSHRIVAELLELGVEPEQTYRSIFARESTQRMRLLGHTLEGVQTKKDGRIAWIEIALKDRKHYGATIEDTESFVGALTLLKGVEIAAMFREEEDGRIKISLRGLAKASVIEIARGFGGGGHRFAAGARVSGKLSEVVPKVLKSCEVTLG